MIELRRLRKVTARATAAAAIATIGLESGLYKMRGAREVQNVSGPPHLRVLREWPPGWFDTAARTRDSGRYAVGDGRDESFDGTYVQGPIVDWVCRAYAHLNPIGWAPMAAPSAFGYHLVAAWSGDYLVAVVAPLIGSRRMAPS